MSEEAITVQLLLDELLRDSKKQATSMSLPFAVHHKLDVLADRAQAVNPSRAEIIGMLIAESDLQADRLEAMIVAYRKKTVRDVLPTEMERAVDVGDNVVELPVRQPGRPPGRRAAGRSIPA